jgi:Kef-type K+ transport system membrane component KefB
MHCGRYPRSHVPSCARRCNARPPRATTAHANVHFTNLLIVVAVGLLAPLVLGFFPRFRLPAIVLEIVLGIAIGPPGLDWVQPDLPVSILALVGLAFLLFLSGLEIDVERLRGRVLKLTALGFGVSCPIAIVVGLGLQAGGFVKSPLFVAIVLVATSLGVIVPVLKDSVNISSSFGQLVIAAASIADFGAIILLSLFFSGKGSTSTAATLILLGVFGLVVLLVGLAIAGFEHSMSLSRVLQRLRDTTAQIRVRAAFVLLLTPSRMRTTSARSPNASSRISVFRPAQRPSE